MQNFMRPLRAAITLVALVLTSCVGAESPSPSASSEPSPSSSEAEPTSEPTSTPLPLALTWTNEPFPALTWALTEDGGSLVAVGRDADGLASWTSADGADWERHDVPDPTFITQEMIDLFGDQIFNGTQMGQMTRLGDTLFSFGTFYGPNDFYRPVAYGSPDGTSWEFVESDSEFYQVGSVTDVETFDDGLVAARITGLIGPNNALWTWEDGASWQETSIQSGPGAALIRLDAAASADQVIVVGQVAEHDSLQSPGENHAVAWTSSDAVDWDELDLPPGMASACGVEVTPDGGWTVMGIRPNGDVAIWTTSDGSTWARFDLGVGLCGDDPVTLAGDWLVASTSSGDEGAKIWLSSDGLDWVQQAIPEIRSVAVAELNGQLHILGTPMTDEPYASVLLHGVP